ncbi:MAG TPA: hypothetical protein EYM35_00195 [Rhodospirillales bacterium]|nr:hypothetical protein [Rhodospirillales bacterium]
MALYLGIVTLRNGLVLSNYAAIKWAMMAGNAVVAFYVWRSQFIRDLFEEFPPPEKERRRSLNPETDIQGRPGNDPHGNFLLAPRTSPSPASRPAPGSPATPYNRQNPSRRPLIYFFLIYRKRRACPDKFIFLFHFQ